MMLAIHTRIIRYTRVVCVVVEEEGVSKVWRLLLQSRHSVQGWVVVLMTMIGVSIEKLDCLDSTMGR